MMNMCQLGLILMLVSEISMKQIESKEVTDLGGTVAGPTSGVVMLPGVLLPAGT